MANESLLAAINAAVDTPSTEVEDTDDAADETELEDSADGGEGAEDAGEDVGEGSGAEDADGDGTEGEEEVSAEDAETEGAEEGAGKDGKPAAKPAAKNDAPAGTPKDPLNDPIDPRLKEATRERITGLIGIAKEATAKYEQVNAEYTELRGYIAESKATGEQFGQALEYIGAVNSGDPAKMEMAWNFMMGEMQALGRMLGKDVPGLDYLAAHPDLKAAVAAGQVTEAVAKETARLRDHQAQQQQIQQHSRQQQQTNEQRTAILTQGKNELNALGAQLRAANPAEYAAKSKVLTAALKGTFSQLDPRQWAAAYKRAYDNLQLPKTAAPAAAPAKKPALPKNQPLRGQNPAGGKNAAPKSMFDAINLALDEVPQR